MICRQIVFCYIYKKLELIFYNTRSYSSKIIMSL